MTTKTNQENQKTNGQHDLGQITVNQKPCNQMHCEVHQTGNYAPKDNSREAVENTSQTTAQRHQNISYPWVIVEGVGCDEEQIATEHHSFSDAAKALHRNYGTDEIEGMPVCIMRRDENGTLTTEF